MRHLLLGLFLLPAIVSHAQLDKDQLALEVYRADTTNTGKLKAYLWQRHSDVSIDGEVKLQTTSAFSFDEKGEITNKVIDEKTTVKQKPGLRGKMQEDAVADKAEYVQNALKLSLAYTFMTKGQLVDLFTKATVTEKNGQIQVDAQDVYEKGDTLTIIYDAKTKLVVSKTFSSKMGADAVSGQLEYGKFENGVVHGTTTVLKLPAQHMVINAKNQNYSIRVQ